MSSSASSLPSPPSPPSIAALQEIWRGELDVFRRLPDGMMLTDSSTRVVFANEALATLTGFSVEQLQSMHIADLDVNESADEVAAHSSEIARSGSDYFRTRWRHADGQLRHVEISASLWHDGSALLCFVRDISDLIEARRKAERSKSLLTYLTRANALVSSSDDTGTMYKALCELATELDSRIALAWIGIVDPRTDSVLIAASSGAATAYLDQLQITLDPNSPQGQGPTACAIRDNTQFVVNRFLDDVHTAPWHERARRFDLAGSVSMPFCLNGVPCGALMLYSTEVDSFDPEMAQLIALLGANISRALDYLHERRERESALRELRSNQQLLEIALEGAGESVWTLNLDTGAGFWSPAFYKMLGYPNQAFSASSAEWLAHMHPEDSDTVLASLDDQLARKVDLLEVEYRFGAADNSWRWIRGRGRVVEYAADGHPVKISGTNLDFTAQHYILEQQRRQTERGLALTRFAENADNLSESELLTYGLEQAERLTGSAMGFLHFVNPDQETLTLVTWTARALTQCQAAHDTHYPISQAGIWADAFRARRPVIVNDYNAANVARKGLPDGHAPLKRLISVPVIEGDQVKLIAGVGNKAEPYQQEDVDFVLLLLTDLWRVVQRARAEKALRDALGVIEASPVVSFRWRAEASWPVDYVSANITRWGYTPAELLAGMPRYAELVHADDIDRVAADVSRNNAAGMTEYDKEYRVRHADGQYFWVSDHTRVVRDAAGQAIFYEGVVSDIHARKQAEAKLTENLAQQRQLNKKLEDAQNQLLQSEKMASIGQLAAGVAHELNNPIGFVHSNLGTLETYLKDIFEIASACEIAASHAINPADFEVVETMKQAKDFDYIKSDIAALMSESKDGLARVKKIVQDLKDFSRAGESDWQTANIHQGLDSTLNIVWNELKYKCTVTKHYATDLPAIRCLPSQLNQVFMNLLVNAAHAIPDKGEITITTRRLNEDEIEISFRDTGAGIAPEHLTHIFEPFFTTKPVGKGTGLGLSIAWGIIGKHQGTIAATSTPGQGTTFTITLPIQPPDAADAADPAHEAAP